VLVCVAEPLLQAGVRACLADRADIEVVDEDPVRRSVDVVVADSSTANGVAEEGWLGLRRWVQFARVLVITERASEHTVQSGPKQGIHGVMLTRSPISALLSGIRTLSRGGKYLCPLVAQQLAQNEARATDNSPEEEIARAQDRRVAFADARVPKLEDLRVDVLAAKAFVSPSTLRRRLTRIHGGFRLVRERLLVDASLTLLRGSLRSVEAVAIELGYADARSFRRFIKGATGMTPEDLRARRSVDLASAS